MIVTKLQITQINKLKVKDLNIVQVFYFSTIIMSKKMFHSLFDIHCWKYRLFNGLNENKIVVNFIVKHNCCESMNIS